MPRRKHTARLAKPDVDPSWGSTAADNVPLPSLAPDRHAEEPGPNDIVFTQFLRPDGRTTCVWIERPIDIVLMAQRLITAGCVFEIEELMDHTVSMTVERRGDESPVAIELCLNGPEVPWAVDKLIRAAVAKVRPPLHERDERA